tara:strand:+ start:3896 stop:4372 length:477 start_codon:yes stop_codon:yes gene_type:complete
MSLVIESLTWCDAGSSVVGIDEVIRSIKEKSITCEVHVGCDSHFIQNKCIFAVVVALYEPGNGGTYFFARHKLERSKLLNMKMRLLKETEIAIDMARLISDKAGVDSSFVHLDINPDKRFKSSQVFTSATSWVKSQGYECIVKPDSWASSWLADAYAK